jgi:uncharacterized protein (DUF427 family)
MPAAKVLLNGKVIAESESSIVVEGSQYFAPESVSSEYFPENDRHATCHRQGVGCYLDIIVEGKEAGSAAWTYHAPLPPPSTSRTTSPSTATKSTPSKAKSS